MDDVSDWVWRDAWGGGGELCVGHEGWVREQVWDGG